MPWWAWLLAGTAVGALGYLVAGNAVAFRRHRAHAREPIVPIDRTYIAARTSGRTVNFKGEDEAAGGEIGPVFITDEQDADFLHEVGWMKISDARELARDLGHAFNAD
jgi:hypothetical protein